MSRPSRRPSLNVVPTQEPEDYVDNRPRQNRRVGTDWGGVVEAYIKDNADDPDSISIASVSEPFSSRDAYYWADKNPANNLIVPTACEMKTPVPSLDCSDRPQDNL